MTETLQHLQVSLGKENVVEETLVGISKDERRRPASVFCLEILIVRAPMQNLVGCDAAFWRFYRNEARGPSLVPSR